MSSIRSPGLSASLVEPGCWRALGDRRWRERPALFLDRDGVIVVDSGHLKRPEEVVLIPGAAATIAAFNRAGVPVMVVTNQSGIARGYFTWADFEAVQGEMARQLAEDEAWIDAAFACAYHGEGRGVLAQSDHPWCKPNPGMLLAAQAACGVNLERSVIVGDRARDLASGRAAGLSRGLQVLTGHGGEAAELAACKALAGDGFAVEQAGDLSAALTYLPWLLES